MEAGIHTIGEAAWQSCLRLQMVQLPSTAVCLEDGVFRRSYVLRAVHAPGCKQYGRSLFEECCSLLQAGATGETKLLLLRQCAKVDPRISLGSVRERSTRCNRLQFSQAAGPIQVKSGSPNQADTDSPMGKGDDDATLHEGEGESLSSRPSSSHARQGIDAMADESDEAGSTIPPQGVDHNADDSSSNLSESPIKRRPAAKPGSWRSQFKKLRQSAGQEQSQPLTSIPENMQRPVTLADLANMSAPMQGPPVRRDPATPSSHPADEQEQQIVTAEIELGNDQVEKEQGGTAATDLQLASEQVAMQGLHNYQVAAQAATTPARKGIALPSTQLYSDLPREWPMARLCISGKQVNRYVRTALWRRAAESALRGTYFGKIPEEVRPDLIGDLLQISQAFAAPLAELFAFVKQGHQPCSFIPQKQLELYANPQFWQYGLLAFVSGCCAFNIELRLKRARATKADPAKQEESSENEVDALTFTQTVIMSFVLFFCTGKGAMCAERHKSP